MSQSRKAHDIEWRGNHPFPVEKEVITKDDIATLHFAAQTQPYIGKKDEQGYFINDFEEWADGRPSAEVIARRKVQKAAEGDNEMIKYNEDRTLGKPTQYQENLNVAMKWEDLTRGILVRDAEAPLLEPDLKEYVDVDLTDDYHLIESKEDEPGAVLKVSPDEIFEDADDYLDEYL